MTMDIDHLIFDAGDVVLQSGRTFPAMKIAYKTWGTLNADRSNVIVYPTSFSSQHHDTQWLIREAPKHFSIYSGDDPTAVALMLCGGHGNVSVTANVAPRRMHELCAAAMAGDVQRAMALQFGLMPLHKHLFVEANPIPVKWAMARMKLCGGALRLPMTELTQANEAVVEGALRACGLLERHALPLDGSVAVGVWTKLRPLDTPLRASCPGVDALIGRFACSLHAVRFLRLGPETSRPRSRCRSTDWVAAGWRIA